MFASLLIILLSSFSCFVLALPPLSPSLYRRTDNPSSKISTTILAPNGTDITSSFRTMVYNPRKRVAPDQNITICDDTQKMNPRGTLTTSYLGRPLGGNGFCSSPTAEFQHSICKRSLGVPATIQEFVIYCQETVEQPVPTATSRGSRTRLHQSPRPSPRPSTANRGGIASTSYEPHNPPVLAEEGSCWEDEVCVDGIFAQKGYPALASCVLEEDYKEEDDEDASQRLGGSSAQITVTALDHRVPVKMRQLGIEAAKRGNRNAGSSSMETIKECVDCFQLTTDALAPDTDTLKIEASVMTAGALTGVIWMTFG